MLSPWQSTGQLIFILMFVSKWLRNANKYLYSAAKVLSSKLTKWGSTPSRPKQNYTILAQTHCNWQNIIDIVKYFLQVLVNTNDQPVYQINAVVYSRGLKWFKFTFIIYQIPCPLFNVHLLNWRSRLKRNDACGTCFITAVTVHWLIPASKAPSGP